MRRIGRRRVRRPQHEPLNPLPCGRPANAARPQGRIHSAEASRHVVFADAPGYATGVTATPPRLPRQIAADPRHDAIRAALTKRMRRLWPGGTIDVPVLSPTAAVLQAIRHAERIGQVCRGIDPALRLLTNAEHSRTTLAARGGTAPAGGEAISRLLLFANDGTERFYRQIETALLRHAPRLAGFQLDCDSAAFGAALWGDAALAKLVMLQHKDAVAAVLRALVE